MGNGDAMSRTTPILVAVLVACAPALARAQRGLTPESRQAIMDYQLTLPRAEHLITALDAMTRYVVSLPDYQERLRKSATMTPAERAAQMEKDPKTAAILKDNGLTARDYLVGVLALRMALMGAQGADNGPNIAYSPANLAFAKANLGTLKPKMDAVDGGGRR
jgi:hypothetical protein